MSLTPSLGFSLSNFTFSVSLLLFLSFSNTQGTIQESEIEKRGGQNEKSHREIENASYHKRNTSSHFRRKMPIFFCFQL